VVLLQGGTAILHICLAGCGDSDQLAGIQLALCSYFSASGSLRATSQPWPLLYYFCVQAVLMRVHACTTDLFDRAAELAVAKAVAAAGMGPQLLLLFQNGRIEEFLLHHVTLAAADIHQQPVSDAIATTLAHFHLKLVG
jgi:hypothetical protein